MNSPIEVLAKHTSDFVDKTTANNLITADLESKSVQLTAIVQQVKEQFRSHIGRFKMSETLLSDLKNKKTITQSPILREAWNALTNSTNLHMTNEEIVPRLTRAGRAVQLEYPIKTFEPGHLKSHSSQMVPFDTDQGRYESSLPPTIMLTRKDKTDYIYQTDLQQCHVQDEVYTCPEHILNKPLNNDCFLAHVSNIMDDIETHCNLKKSKPMHTVIQLLDDLLYFDLPQGIKMSQHCSTIKDLPVEGQGLIQIPPGCTIRHKLQKFINKHSTKIHRTQSILRIMRDVLTHAQHIDSMWNRAKTSMGVAALSTLLATILSLCFTQCSTVLTLLGCRKLRKQRKKSRGMSTAPATYATIPPKPDLKPLPPTPIPDSRLFNNAIELRNEQEIPMETLSTSQPVLSSPSSIRRLPTPPTPPPKPESPAVYRNMLAMY